MDSPSSAIPSVPPEAFLLYKLRGCPVTCPRLCKGTFVGPSSACLIQEPPGCRNLFHLPLSVCKLHFLCADSQSPSANFFFTFSPSFCCRRFNFSRGSLGRLIGHPSSLRKGFASLQRATIVPFIYCSVSPVAHVILPCIKLTFPSLFWYPSHCRPE